MVGRRTVCAIGLGAGLAAAGCTPKAPAAREQLRAAAPTPARRTSSDPDTNRILTEIGETIAQLTIYSDRIYVTTEDGRELLSSGGAFAPVKDPQIPPLSQDPLSADAFLVAAVRRIVDANGGDFGAVFRSEDQVLLEVKQGMFPMDETVRCALPPDKEVPAYGYQEEQGLTDGLAELRAVQRTETYALGLRHDAKEGTAVVLHGRSEQQDQEWLRDQFRPLTRGELFTPRSTEPLDPAMVTTQSLMRLAGSLVDRSGTGELNGMELLVLSRNGKPRIEFTATDEDGLSLVGDADLSGRITRTQ